MKINATRVAALLLLIALSVGFGFAFDAIATGMEKHKCPRPENLSAFVEADAKEFGVPEAILWAFLKTESGFASNAVSDDGKIGLMQLDYDTFCDVTVNLLGDAEPAQGLLFDPETNLRAGAALLSSLYSRYGVWENVYAAYHAGITQVDEWLADARYVDARGALSGIPDKATAAFMREMSKTVSLYGKLYYAV